MWGSAQCVVRSEADYLASPSLNPNPNPSPSPSPSPTLPLTHSVVRSGAVFLSITPPCLGRVTRVATPLRMTWARGRGRD